MSHYVYILRCHDKTLYVGSTRDIRNRLRYHTNGLVTTTKYKLPVKLEWYCCFSNKSKALQFEKYLKNGSGFAFSRKRFLSG